MTNAIVTDISHWDDNPDTPTRVDFALMRLNACGVICKASQGLATDRDFAYSWQAAKVAGLLRGAYHFLVWDIDPIEQADYFWGHLAADSGDFPPIVDYEWWRSNTDALTVLRRFTDELEDISGKVPMIYTAPGYWQQYGSKHEFWSRFPLWLAHYNVPAPRVPAPWRAWRLWQYTSKGDGAAFGVESKDIDLNQFNGTERELRDWLGVAEMTNRVYLPGVMG